QVQAGVGHGHHDVGTASGLRRSALLGAVWCRGIDVASNRIGKARSHMRWRFADRTACTAEPDLPAAIEAFMGVNPNRLPHVAGETHVEPRSLEVLLDLLESLVPKSGIDRSIVAKSIRGTNVFIRAIIEAIGVLKMRAEKAIVLIRKARQRRVVFPCIAKVAAEFRGV